MNPIITWHEFPTKWFNRDWWQYLFEKPVDGWTLSNIWCSFNCRRMGHPAGIIYFNAGGLEPDYTCRGCGDNLG